MAPTFFYSQKSRQKVRRLHLTHSKNYSWWLKLFELIFSFLKASNSKQFLTVISTLFFGSSADVGALVEIVCFKSHIEHIYKKKTIYHCYGLLQMLFLGSEVGGYKN